MKDGFIRVAAATPEIQVADCRYNREQIEKMKVCYCLISDIMNQKNPK